MTFPVRCHLPCAWWLPPLAWVLSPTVWPPSGTGHSQGCAEASVSWGLLLPRGVQPPPRRPGRPWAACPLTSLALLGSAGQAGCTCPSPSAFHVSPHGSWQSPPGLGHTRTLSAMVCGSFLFGAHVVAVVGRSARWAGAWQAPTPEQGSAHSTAFQRHPLPCLVSMDSTPLPAAGAGATSIPWQNWPHSKGAAVPPQARVPPPFFRVCSVAAPAPGPGVPRACGQLHSGPSLGPEHRDPCFSCAFPGLAWESPSKHSDQSRGSAAPRAGRAHSIEVFCR